MASITAAEARLAIPGITGTGIDTDLTTLIARADAMIARWLGYRPASAGVVPTFEDTAYTHYTHRDPAVRVLDGVTLEVPMLPLLTVTSVHEDDDWTYGTGDLVAATDYVVDSDAGLIRLKPSSTHGAWSTGRGAIKVVYTGGFSTIPADIQQAVMLLVQRWWSLRRDGGRTNFGEGGVNVSVRDETMPESVAQILAPYLLPRTVL